MTTLPPRLDLPEELWAALEKTLSKNPRERPGAAQAAAQFRRLAREFADLPALVAFRGSRGIRGHGPPGDGAARSRDGAGFRADGGCPERRNRRNPSWARRAPAPSCGRCPAASPARPVEPAEPEKTASRWPAWLTRKVLVLGAAGLGPGGRPGRRNRPDASPECPGRGARRRPTPPPANRTSRCPAACRSAARRATTRRPAK